MVSFGRSALRVNEDSVGLLLQSCIGGIDTDFRVLHLSHMMFRFSVFSKDVGFMIYRLKSFSCKLFKDFFHLCGSGGPDWKRDFARWQAEQEAEWTVSKPKSKPKSYAEAVSSTVRPDRSVFSRISYPSDYF